MLDIIPTLLLATGVVFLVLLVVLNKTLYKPLLDFMENRDKSIAKDLEGADKNSSDILIYKQEAEKIIVDAKKEANQIKELALQSTRDSILQKIESKKSELEEEHNKFAKELKSQRDELKATLLEKMPLLQDSVSLKISQI